MSQANGTRTAVTPIALSQDECNRTPTPTPLVSRLRRDLGTIESYAELMGIMVVRGAFFKSTTPRDGLVIDWPQRVHAVRWVMPAILGNLSSGCWFLFIYSIAAGPRAGREYLNISRTLGGFAWPTRMHGL